MEPGDEPAAVEGAAAVIVESLSSAAELIIVLVSTGLGNTSMAPSSVVGPVGPTFFGRLVTSTPTPYISGLANVFILVLLPGGAPLTVVGTASGPICVLVTAGVGKTSLTVDKMAATLFFVLAASVVSEGVASWTSATSMTAAELDADFICVPTTSVSVSAIPSMLAGIVTESTSRTILFLPPPWDWLMLLLVLLSPRDIGGMDAAVFKVLAQAYSARIWVTMCLLGLDGFRFGRSWLLFIDNLPLCTFLLTGWVKPYSLPSVLVEGFLVGVLVNLIAPKKLLVLKGLLNTN
jgi:hypothetical protein